MVWLVFHGYLLGSISAIRVRRAVISIGVGRAGGRLAGVDANGPDARLGGGAHQVDRQQAVVEAGAHDLDAVGEHEGALELARGDAAMEDRPDRCRRSACRAP